MVVNTFVPLGEQFYLRSRNEDQKPLLLLRLSVVAVYSSDTQR